MTHNPISQKTFTRDDIDWVWVDLDDTIWDFKNNSWDALAMVYHEAGLDKAFNDVDSWRNIYLENNHRLWALYNSGAITKEFLMMERFRVILVNAGYSDTDARKLSPKLSDIYLDRLAAMSRLVPGALQLLNHLRDKEYHIGIISNGFYEVQYRKMQSSNITHYFETIVLSDDIGVNKPDVRIFNHAVAKAQTTANRSIIIGDNPTTDIIGAINAGWNAICFNHNGCNESPTPTQAIEITHLDEALALLQ